MSENSITKVVVIGGGYAGASAANRLQQRDDVEITLVNPRPEFVERIRLHQFVAGNYDAGSDLGTVVGERVRVVVDGATRIDTGSRTVELASGSALDYDYVIYAVGSTAATPGAVPGATEFAYPIGEWEFAGRLRTAVAAMPSNGRITVVGGGLTGIETASELAEAGHAVTLVCGGRLAPTFLEPARRSLAKWLKKNGVEVVESLRVAEVRADVVVLADGSVVPSAVTIWTAGFGVPELAARSGLRTDKLGRLLTDETLTSADDDRIIAAGDAAAPSGQPLRMSCQAAIPLGVQAAETVLSRIAGDRPAALNIGFVASCVSLGRRAATMQIARKDDTSTKYYVGGLVGAALKEMICKGTVSAIRKEARKPGSISITKGDGNRPAQAEFEREVITHS
ncbi:NAD(P)/FAD-dependent oxidoreductase [Nocardia sp. NPDC127526]|uniref:NAD(P)/FAD-dependent oxidoreductase n=1 Tax=Nocardia sp. NPDC127526 TaxID=3345393 RepID=UPI0036347A6B